MRRLLVLMAALAVAGALSASAAFADSPHFKKGGSPTCSINFNDALNSASTTCSGVMAGLGNADVLITISTSGTAVYQCKNAGGNVAPGQNKVLVGPATASELIPSGEVKNGNLAFTSAASVLTASATVSAAVAGCPNNNWTGVNPVLTVTSISLTIEQPPGTVIFSCSATDSWTQDTSGIALSC